MTDLYVSTKGRSLDTDSNLLDTGTNIGKKTLSITELFNSIRENKDPHETIKLFYTLQDTIGETCGSFSTLIQRNKELHNALESFLLKTPIVPGSPLQRETLKLINDLKSNKLINAPDYGKKIRSALSAAELAGSVSEAQTGNRSSEFIEAATQCFLYILKHYPSGLPKHELFGEGYKGSHKIIAKWMGKLGILRNLRSNMV